MKISLEVLRLMESLPSGCPGKGCLVWNKLHSAVMSQLDEMAKRFVLSPVNLWFRILRCNQDVVSPNSSPQQRAVSSKLGNLCGLCEWCKLMVQFSSWIEIWGSRCIECDKLKNFYMVNSILLNCRWWELNSGTFCKQARCSSSEPYPHAVW